MHLPKFEALVLTYILDTTFTFKDLGPDEELSIEVQYAAIGTGISVGYIETKENPNRKTFIIHSHGACGRGDNLIEAINDLNQNIDKQIKRLITIKNKLRT